MYFLQDVNCGFKNKQNTVDSWLGLHREYEEFVLKNEAYMFNKISKMIDLQELNLLFNSNSSMNDIISIYYNVLLNLYYLSYNTDIDFKTQFIKNTECILDVTNELAITLYHIAKKIINNFSEINDTALIDDNAYFKIIKLDEEEKPTEETEYISVQNDNGRLYINEHLKDEELAKLTEFFS